MKNKIHNSYTHFRSGGFMTKVKGVAASAAPCVSAIALSIALGASPAAAQDITIGGNDILIDGVSYGTDSGDPGVLDIGTSVIVTGDVEATGNVTADGGITVGNTTAATGGSIRAENSIAAGGGITVGNTTAATGGSIRAEVSLVLPVSRPRLATSRPRLATSGPRLALSLQVQRLPDQVQSQHRTASLRAQRSLVVPVSRPRLAMSLQQ
jgi:hypothetical protein